MCSKTGICCCRQSSSGQQMWVTAVRLSCGGISCTLHTCQLNTIEQQTLSHCVHQCTTTLLLQAEQQRAADLGDSSEAESWRHKLFQKDQTAGADYHHLQVGTELVLSSVPNFQT